MASRPLLALAAALVLVLLPAGARAACAGPSVAATAVSGTVQVEGRRWVLGCQDACSCTSGCTGQTCDCGPPPRPVDTVVVEVLDATGAVLGTGDARPGDDGAFTTPLAVPADAVPATVRVRSVTDEIEVVSAVVSAVVTRPR